MTDVRDAIRRTYDEYFTVFHPKVIDSQSPTVLAIVWGVIATWWVGLPLGIILATAARAGDAPQRTARSLVRPLAKLLCVMFGAALLAGCTGYVAMSAVWVKPSRWMEQFIPPEKHAAFVADFCAHNMSYFWAASAACSSPVRSSSREHGHSANHSVVAE